MKILSNGIINNFAKLTKYRQRFCCLRRIGLFCWTNNEDNFGRIVYGSEIFDKMYKNKVLGEKMPKVPCKKPYFWS